MKMTESEQTRHGIRTHLASLKHGIQRNRRLSSNWIKPEYYAFRSPVLMDFLPTEEIFIQLITRASQLKKYNIDIEINP